MNGNLAQRWTQLGPFFKNWDTFCWFSKWTVDRRSFASSPSRVLVSAAEHALMLLNMPKYPWKCLNKLFWLCQDSEYTWSSYMFDRLFKISQIINVPEFWVWHGCICKGYTKFWRCLKMVQYASIMPEYGSVCLNIPQYA